jgi:hypothetical protein
MRNGAFLIGFQMSPTLTEASSYINPSEKNCSNSQNYIWQFNNTLILNVLFPMTRPWLGDSYRFTGLKTRTSLLKKSTFFWGDFSMIGCVCGKKSSRYGWAEISELISDVSKRYDSNINSISAYDQTKRQRPSCVFFQTSWVSVNARGIDSALTVGKNNIYLQLWFDLSPDKSAASILGAPWPRLPVHG